MDDLAGHIRPAGAGSVVDAGCYPARVVFLGHSQGSTNGRQAAIAITGFYAQRG